MSVEAIKAPNTDTLVKPDMQAVLERTHLTVNLRGLLLPIFEALSNSFDGIEQRFGETAIKDGRVSVHFQHLKDKGSFVVSVLDNGIGLNTENYKSFLTPYSGYKLSKKGRGFGRFIAFKVFSNSTYSSRFEDGGVHAYKVFNFDVAHDNEIEFLPHAPEFPGLGLSVTFSAVKEEWWQLFDEITEEDIRHEIGAHFLPYFMSRTLPAVFITFDDAKPENITSHFKALFAIHGSGDFDCEIDGVHRTLHYTLTKIPKSRMYKSHSLLVSAADRIVGSPRDLATKIGTPYFVDEKDEKYIILSVVSGEAFESRLNDSRTSIDLPAKAIESIVNSVCLAIQEREAKQIEKIKEDQNIELTQALQENPILRIGLKGMTQREYVAKKPNHWRTEEFVQDLALTRYRATNDLRKQIVEAASDEAQYVQNLQNLAGKLDAGKKEALAEYVLHRRSIIELLDAARKFNSDKRRGTEDNIHSLVFRRFSDSVNTDYFEHNLWLIDDALAFTPYASSDRTMHGGRRAHGDKVGDLLFFDDSMILGEDSGSSLTIVEFKKPSRDDYRFGDAKSDPVTQVLDTINGAIHEGGITKSDGSHVSFGNVTRRQAFIVADITKSLTSVLKRHDLVNDCDPNVWYSFRKQDQVLIQVYGYDTLISTAKKRNLAFCKILLGE